MSALDTLLEKKRAFEQLQAEIAELEKSKELQEEQKFMEELNALLDKHNKSYEDLRAFIPKKANPKIKLKIGEHEYVVSGRGRFPAEVSAIFEKSKMDREEFIKKYKVE